MKFDYLKLPTANPKHRWIARPMLPVRLIGPTGKWQGLALVDSGADVSLFGERVGKRIGISDVGPRVEKFGGVEGGSLSAKLSGKGSKAGGSTAADRSSSVLPPMSVARWPITMAFSYKSGRLLWTLR